jgi:hypothetical protein
VLKLKAVPGKGSRFAGWSGGCRGTGICKFIVGKTKRVTAIFAINIPTKLNVRSDQVALTRNPHSDKGAKPPGTMVLIARSAKTAAATVTGTVTETLKKKKGEKARPTRRFVVKKVRFSVRAGKGKLVTVRLPKAALAGLRAGHKESVVFTLTVRTAKGLGVATAKVGVLEVRKLKP